MMLEKSCAIRLGVSSTHPPHSIREIKSYHASLTHATPPVPAPKRVQAVNPPQIPSRCFVVLHAPGSYFWSDAIGSLRTILYSVFCV